MTFKPDLTRLKIKLELELVGTDGGAHTNTLRAAVLSLGFSVAEYCAFVDT